MKTIIRLWIPIFAIVIFSMTGLSPSWAGINDGLVAYYPFNGNAIDESGNENNGIAHGATLAPDRFNNPDSAYDFNHATSDYISVLHNDSLNLTDSYSFSVWIFQKTASPDGYRIIDKATAGSCNGWTLDTYDGVTGRRIRMDVSCPWVISNTEYSLNQWHHIVVTVNGGNVAFYLDGQPDGSGSVGGTPTNALDLYIGTTHPVDSYYNFDGLIDDVRIYNRVLTETEIQELYSTTASPKYTLTITKSGNGNVTADTGTISWSGNTGTASYDSGTSLTLTAAASNDWDFTSWSGCDSTNGNQCTITMNAVKNVAATFTLNPHQFTLAITKSGTGNGSISSSPSGIECGSVCSAQYNHGAVVTLTPAPNAGSVFTGWSGGGCSGNGMCIITLNSDTSTTATFTAVQAGTPKISVKPKSLNFGSLKAGSTSSAKSITVNNTGKGSLTINSITLSGSNASEFNLTNDCTTVSAKSSCTVLITFTPTISYGKKSALISIASNDPQKPTVNVKLLGQVLPPKISVSPVSVNFEKVSVGSTSEPKIVTIKNKGISDLEVSSITINGTNASEFSQTNDCSTIVKGSSCAVTLTFSPTSAGSKRATMDLSTSDPKKPIYTVKLSARASGGQAGPSIQETYKVITADRWDIVSSTNGGTGYISFAKTNDTVSFSGYGTNDSPVAGFAGPVSLLFFKYPVMVGETWTASGISNGYTLSSITVVENSAEQVTVFAGTFSCVVNTETITAPSIYNNGVYVAKRKKYFAPGVGLVKVVNTWKNGDITVGELQAYSIPNASPSDYFPLNLNSWWSFIWT